MDEGTTVQQLTRREAVQRVAALLGGAALAGGDRLFAFSFEPSAIEKAMAQGTGAVTAADVALLDEIAETILPETSTPGAKAAKVGAFMALMVSEAYDERERQVFQQGLRQLDDACRHAHTVSFMQASAAQRLSLGQRDVAGFAHKAGKMLVRDCGLIHPEAIYPDQVDRPRVGKARVFTPHPELTTRHPDHSVRDGAW